MSTTHKADTTKQLVTFTAQDVGQRNRRLEGSRSIEAKPRMITSDKRRCCAAMQRQTVADPDV